MCRSKSSLAFLWACGMMVVVSAPTRGDESGDQSPRKSDVPATKSDADAPAINLLEALRDGKVSADAEGTGDGRMTLSLTNRTRWGAPRKLVQSKWESPGRVSPGGTHEKAKERRRGRAITP